MRKSDEKKESGCKNLRKNKEKRSEEKGERKRG
jgi:hypothetical protein